MSKIFGSLEVKENEPLKEHTTFKIGGDAKYYAEPKNIKELKKLLEICKSTNMRYFIIGNGSNLLASDNGFDGLIIALKNFNDMKIQKNKGFESVCVGAGINLFLLNKNLANNGISGLEWSYGIPGTLGGAIKMNAGAFNHCIFEFLEELTVIKNGKLKKINNLKAEYRNSFLTDEIVISAKLKLKSGNMHDILNKMNEYLSIRRDKQPYNLPSAGSVFKRNADIIPAKIIDDLGLKGLRMGGAMISTKHAGFIVNVDNAKSEDVNKLINLIKKIAAYNGFLFEEEIIYLK